MAEGYDCQLFTAGAEGDYAFAEHVLESLPDDVLAGRVALAPRPQKPAQLVQLVADSDAVIAQRMHPTIIAYALRRPSVGLGWNQKLDSFFTSVERAGYCVPATDLCVDRVTDLLAQALAEGIPADRHAAVTSEARANIQSLARALRKDPHKTA